MISLEKLVKAHPEIEDQHRSAYEAALIRMQENDAQEGIVVIPPCPYCGEVCRTPLVCGRRARAQQQHKKG